MSKTKTKSVPTGSKPAVLSKVKDGAVAKPAQTVKSKSKEIAKKVAAKQDKKTKKVPVKEPTPESSSEEEESESEEEEETKPTKGAKAAESDDSSEESDSDDSASEDEAPKSKAAASKAAPKAAAKAESSDEDSDDSDDSDASMEEAPGKAKAAADEEDSDSSDDSESDDEDAPAPKTNGAAAKASKDESDEEADSDESSGSDDSEEEVEEKPKKRKAEEVEAPAVKKNKVEEGDSSKGSNLFVGNLSWNVDEDWLKQEFEEFGEVASVRLITDRDSGRSKGYGYVEFVNAADAAKAHTAKAGAELDGRVLNVDFANARPSAGEKQENRRKSYGDSLSEPTETLFLGNMSFDVTQDDIYEAFGPYGTVSGVRIPTDRETGNPKGFGYVTFATLEESKAALEAMQGAYINNRPVRVDYTAPRPQNGDSPRGGFGGRGGGRGGFDRGRGRGRGGGRGDFGGRGGRGGSRGGRGGSTNRGGFGDFSGRKTTF